MAQEVDSDILRRVSKVLRLGTRGAQETLFDDETLQQAFDVSQMIRRGGTPLEETGWYVGKLGTVHAGADTQVTTHDPYATNTPAPVGSFIGATGWPLQVPDTLDVWCSQATVTPAGASTLSTGFFGLRTALARDAWGIDVAGAATHDFIYQTWDTEFTFGGKRIALDSAQVGNVAPAFRPFRVPRGSSLVLAVTSAGALTTTLGMMLGLFPAGLGSDQVAS